ncbi:MAG: hypothetical protein HYR91_10450 [Flavobacteriia bacterium]|nr:hypothetical protein [Flavobacteriia bacterium]
MRDSFLVLICFYIHIFLYSQNYLAPTPDIIHSKVIEKTNQQVSIAWFGSNNVSRQVFQFEKVEIGFSLPELLGSKISAFINQSNEVLEKINPFNRHDIDITVDFYLNNKKIKSVDAFYYEEYRKDLRVNKWVKDTTSFNFRARFTPTEAGTYEAKIRLSTKYSPDFKDVIEFIVVQNQGKGFLELGNDNKHFRFSNTKASFFPVGQVIPWADIHDGKLDQVGRPKDFESLYNALQKLKKSKGNFTRFVASPWFMEMESEALGNYSPMLGQAWEFDRLNEDCIRDEIYYIFCLRLHTPLESRPSSEIGWETNCYNDLDKTPATIAHEAPIGVKSVLEYFSNEKAKDFNKNYYRYMISRWGYSTSLAAWQIMSEVDNTYNYKDEQETKVIKGENVVVNSDHSENRKQVRIWTHDMIRFLEYDLEDLHLKSIAMSSGLNYSSTFFDPEIFNIPEIDFFGLHHYVYEIIPPTGKVRNRNISFRFKAINDIGVGYQNGNLSYPDFQHKMFIYDEFGQDVAVPKDWPLKDYSNPTVDYNNYTGFMFKQDLWFTATAGCGVAGLDWWNSFEVKRQADWELYLPGIRLFFDGIDFENVNYSKVQEFEGKFIISQRWPNTEKEINSSIQHNYSSKDLLEVYTQVSSEGKQGFGWINNRSINWMNLLDSIKVIRDMYEGKGVFSKKYLYKPNDDDKVDKPIDIENDTYYFKIYFLQKKKIYTINFYNTITGALLSTKEYKSNRKGELKVYAPEMKFESNTDLAYKVFLKGNDFE